MIGQYDQIQNITGEFNSALNVHQTSTVDATGAFSGTRSPNVDGAANNASLCARTTINFDASRIVRAGTETRPVNITVKIWKRTA